jgi:uncharacterized protein (TIGR02246 family)
VIKTGFALSIFVVACMSPALAEDSAKGLLSKLDAEYDRSWSTHDARKVAALFTADAVFLPPGTPAGTGPKAVSTFFEGLFKGKWSDHKLIPIAANRVGDKVIVASSHWSANLTGDDGKTSPHHGDVAQVFERVGGEWKIALASWNIITEDNKQ